MKMRTAGTVASSSRWVARRMTSHVDFNKDLTILELGAGDGAITKYILKKMSAKSRLFSFEVNPRFCTELKKIDDARLKVIEDSALHIENYLGKEEKTDYIISAVPFVVLPKDQSMLILEKAKEHLRQGGLFIQLHYSLLAKKYYIQVFGNVNISFVPLNIPPAFIHTSENKK